MNIFDRDSSRELLEGKNILFLGGSITRGLYKDLIWLTNSNTLIDRSVLGRKGEERFPDLTEAKEAKDEECNFEYKDQLQGSTGYKISPKL